MGNEKQKAALPKPDGRRLRSERSRQLIIEAMLSLVEEGNLAPTAQQVADRAEVGIRSVFRHFEDMDSIFDIANQLTRSSYDNLFRGADRNGSLAERILHATEQHAEAYETKSLRNMILSTQARRWESATLRKNYATAIRKIRRDLDNWLPELAELPPGRREAVDALASFEMWHRLRELQGLSKQASIDIIVDTLGLLISRN
jgi:AcrR family transcriptional regulator